jgi:Cysteine-rich CPXCG
VPLEIDAAYTCPYCGEENYTGVDPSAGSRQRMVEDCPVCCSPIALTIRVDRDGDAIVESAEEA